MSRFLRYCNMNALSRSTGDADADRRRRERHTYYGAKFLAQTAQNLLFAALFVMAATSDQMAIGLSGIFIAQVIPALLFGLLCGAFVDRIGPARGYVLGAVLRCAVVLTAFLALDGPNMAVWAVAAAYSGVSQIFTPAELAIIPALRRGLAHREHSILSVVQIAGQAMGVAVLAPILFFVGGPAVMIAVALLAFAGVALMALWLGRRLDGTVASVRSGRRSLISPVETFGFFRQEPRAAYAVGLLGFRAVASKAVFVALPIYFEMSMNARTEALAMLLVPGALGGVLGLMLTGRLFERRQARTLMLLSLLAISTGLIAFAALDYGVQSFIYVSTNYQVTLIAPSLSTSIIIGAPITFIIGFGFTSALVSSRTVLTATAPIGQQARVFAAEGWINDTLLILPLLFFGIGTEIVGARPMLFSIGVLGLLAIALLEVAAPRRVGLPAIGRHAREAAAIAPPAQPATEGVPGL